MRYFLICAAAFVSACSSVQTATDQAGRDAAKTIIPETLAVYFQGVPKEYYDPFTNCIVDLALAEEVQALAADAVIGVDQGTADVVRGVLARPQTQTCLTQSVPDELVAF